MRSIGTKCVVGCLLASAAFGAVADTAEYQADQLARYRGYAGASVDQFRMVEIYQSQIVGENAVVIWPTINTAYLLTVDLPCTNLAWAHGFTVTQQQSMTVSKRFDFVKFDNQRCRIVDIRPVDYKAMLRDDAKGTQTSGGM